MTIYIFLILLASLISAACCAYSLMCSRKLTVANALLAEKDALVAEKRKENSQLRSTRDKALAETTKQKRHLENMEEKLTTMHVALEKSTNEYHHCVENYEALQRNALASTEASEAQIKALMVQMRDLDTELAESKRQGIQASQTHNKLLKETVEREIAKVKDHYRKVVKVDNQAQRETRSAQQAKALELKKRLGDMSRRIRQYNVLHQSLQSQKQLLEDRNNNWERALTLLAKWILRDEKELPDAIGPLVSGALEKTKSGPLVDDEFSHPIN